MSSFLLWLLEFLLSWILDEVFSPVKDYIKKSLIRRNHIDEAKEIALSFETYSRQYLKQSLYIIPRIGHIKRYEISEITNAWENGITGIVLTGTAGSGKTGLALDLARDIQSRGIPVLFIRATDYSSDTDPAVAIKHRLSINKDLGESVSILGAKQECVVVIDQLDSISESVAVTGFISFLRTVAEFTGVRILVISRSYEAEKLKLKQELNFSQIESNELDKETAREYLKTLGLTKPTVELQDLSQNLLNLSLMAELVMDGASISNIVGLAQLWEKYVLSIRDRDGETTFITALEIADQYQVSGEKTFSLGWRQILSAAKLSSCGVIIQVPGSQKFRFRHEQLQTFFCAYRIFPELPTPQRIVERYGKYNSKAVLIWLCILYGLKNTQEEMRFITQALNDEGLIPYYTQTAVIDQYSHLDTLESKKYVVQIIMDCLKTDTNLSDYFYNSNPDPVWAQYLWEYGLLSNPPDPENTEHGNMLPHWRAQSYLISVAEIVPEIVIQHVNILNCHAWYLARAIEAVCKIPVEYSEKALPRITDWLSNPEIAEIAQKEALELITILVSNEKNEAAMQLFYILTAKRDESKSYNTRYSYKEVFGYGYNKSATLELLKGCCASELIRIFEERLAKYVYSEGSKTKKISWWRNTIEQTDQNTLDEYQDYVLDALRDTLIVFINDEPPEAAKIVTRYLSDDRDVFRRLGLYLIGRYPDLFKSEVIGELLNPNNLDDIGVHHEFFLLLESRYDLLSDSEKDLLISGILDGPELEKAERIYQSYPEGRRLDHEKFISIEF